MKFLYAARIARFAVNRLARRVTKWLEEDDEALFRLIWYIHHTKNKTIVGWMGDKLEDTHLALYADADFAGCSDSLRCTTGAHLNIQGPPSRFPPGAISKRQGCVSHSTPEAEIVAADTALRSLGLPALSLWETVTSVQSSLCLYDDNQAMLAVARSGRNPTMRYMERTQGVSVAWLHEMFQQEHLALVYEISSKMAADIHAGICLLPYQFGRLRLCV